MSEIKIMNAGSGYVARKERRYLPTFADLIDRLSIVLLKSVFDSGNRAAHLRERDLIEHDLDLLMGNPRLLQALDIRAIMTVMLANRYIWENESAVRAGYHGQSEKLLLTHSINGVRNTAKNVLARRMGERLDLKVDCLSVDVLKNYGNWNLFEETPDAAPRG